MCVSSHHLRGLLQELLGNLFVHPSQLKMEDQVGEGAFAIVNRAR